MTLDADQTTRCIAHLQGLVDVQELCIAKAKTLRSRLQHRATQQGYQSAINIIKNHASRLPSLGYTS